MPGCWDHSVAVWHRDEGVDILILARTDARQAESLDEALARIQAFAEAGVCLKSPLFSFCWNTQSLQMSVRQAVSLDEALASIQAFAEAGRVSGFSWHASTFLAVPRSHAQHSELQSQPEHCHAV